MEKHLQQLKYGGKTMNEIIKESDIDKLSEKEQLEFYKRNFQYQHCEADNCGREVANNWALYNNELFCRCCYEYHLEQEREAVEDEVKRLKRELKIAQERLNEIS
jgi:hypothetical protein